MILMPGKGRGTLTARHDSYSLKNLGISFSHSHFLLIS